MRKTLTPQCNRVSQAVHILSRVLIELTNIAKSWGDATTALHAVNLHPGGNCACCSASGCGKSTTLRILAGLETASAGQVVIDGRGVAATAAGRQHRRVPVALLERKPSQLSGGQQQRVALGRAIIAETRVCLMDEPLSNLDAQLRHEMRREIRALQQRLGITMVYVTHDQIEAMSDGRPGRADARTAASSRTPRRASSTSSRPRSSPRASSARRR